MYDLKQRLSALAQGLPVAVKAYICGSAFPDAHVFACVHRNKCVYALDVQSFIRRVRPTVCKVLPLLINDKGKCV